MNKIRFAQHWKPWSVRNLYNIWRRGNWRKKLTSQLIHLDIRDFISWRTSVFQLFNSESISLTEDWEKPASLNSSWLSCEVEGVLHPSTERRINWNPNCLTRWRSIKYVYDGDEMSAYSCCFQSRKGWNSITFIKIDRLFDWLSVNLLEISDYFW